MIKHSKILGSGTHRVIQVSTEVPQPGTAPKARREWESAGDSRSESFYRPRSAEAMPEAPPAPPSGLAGPTAGSYGGSEKMQKRRGGASSEVRFFSELL